MEGRELRRCYTQVELRPQGDTRHVRTNKKFVMPTNRIKFPTLEIYRPPGQRVTEEVPREEGASRLNVHAKEFVMHHLQASRSTGNILQEGKKGRTGSGVRQGGAHTTLRAPHTQFQGRVVIQEDGKREAREGGARAREGTELRRSKSLYVTLSSGSQHATTNDLGNTTTQSSNNLPTKISGLSLYEPKLPPDLKQLLAKAQGDVGEYTLGELAQLARSLVQKAEEERCYAEKLAEICLSVIEREPHSTFLEALVNSLIFSLERRQEEVGKITSYPMLAFLSHLYTLFKTMGKSTDSKLRMGSHPSIQLLHLLAQTCICTLKNPNLTVRNEIECLFFVVTTIGRELEQECSKLLEELMDCIRDALYLGKTTDRIRRTLLQMLELHGAKWQIPAESLSYYQATTDHQN